MEGARRPSRSGGGATSAATASGWGRWAAPAATSRCWCLRSTSTATRWSRCTGCPLLLWLVCPLLLFWIGRMWLLAHRGQDPRRSHRRHRARPGELPDRSAGGAGDVPGACSVRYVPLLGTVPGRPRPRRWCPWSGAPIRPRSTGFPRRSCPYACGRSYGDSCLNDGGTLLDVRRLDRLIAFDEQRRPSPLRSRRHPGGHPRRDRAARLVPARGARDPLGLRRGRDRERHPWEKPPPRGHLRATRHPARAGALQRRARGLHARRSAVPGDRRRSRLDRAYPLGRAPAQARAGRGHRPGARQVLLARQLLRSGRRGRRLGVHRRVGGLSGGRTATGTRGLPAGGPCGGGGAARLAARRDPSRHSVRGAGGAWSTG